MGVAAESSLRNMGTCGGGDANSASALLPVISIRMRKDARYGILAGIYGMTVTIVSDVAYGAGRQENITTCIISPRSCKTWGMT